MYSGQSGHALISISLINSVRHCYRSDAKVSSCLRVVVDRDVVNDAMDLTHVTKKRVIDVVVEVAESYFLWQHGSHIVDVILKPMHKALMQTKPMSVTLTQPTFDGRISHKEQDEIRRSHNYEKGVELDWIYL